MCPAPELSFASVSCVATTPRPLPQPLAGGRCALLARPVVASATQGPGGLVHGRDGVHSAAKQPQPPLYPRMTAFGHYPRAAISRPDSENTSSSSSSNSSSSNGSNTNRSHRSKNEVSAPGIGRPQRKHRKSSPRKHDYTVPYSYTDVAEGPASTPSSAELLRKYRTKPLEADELELVGFPTTVPDRTSDPGVQNGNGVPSSYANLNGHVNDRTEGPQSNHTIANSPVNGFTEKDSKSGGRSSSRSDFSARRPRGRPRTRAGPSTAAGDRRNGLVSRSGPQNPTSVHMSASPPSFPAPPSISDHLLNTENSSTANVSFHRSQQDGSVIRRSVRSPGDQPLKPNRRVRSNAMRYAKSAAAAASRFPSSWSRVVRQACDATLAALDVGHDRLLVSVVNPELLPRDEFLVNADPRLFADSGMNVPVATEAAAPLSRVELRLPPSFALALDICNAITSTLLARHGACGTSYLPHVARINLLFNSQEEADLARALAHPAAAHLLQFQVLSTSSPPPRQPTDFCIILNPCNKRDNLALIESVELVHYGNWNDSNVVIMINPDLAAITSYPALDGSLRSPGFLMNYVQAFELDTCVFQSKTITGAILRCYPRKWETYMLQASVTSSFRLIAESDSRPSTEKILFDFSWRAGKDVREEVD